MDAITVSADSAHHLERLLECAPLREAFDRIIVVDNACSDATVAVARRHGAHVIEYGQRTGYGRCVNLAVQATRGETFAVLNPDIRFEHAGVAAELARHLQGPGIGIAAPALVLPDGRIQDSARRIPTPLDLVLRRNADPMRGAIWEPGIVPWVVGACFVTRRDVWNAVGGFDESYFLYFEDVDLCWRLRSAGYSVWYDPEVRVSHHHVAASRGAATSWATRRHALSATRFFLRNPRFIVSNRIGSPGRAAPAALDRPAGA